MTLGWYHFNRIVLSVHLDETADEEKRACLPWLFEGFEVLYHFKVSNDEQ
ncbi:MAG: hypothetical protein RIC55_22890 [Pirellulaceae bacterium]